MIPTKLHVSIQLNKLYICIVDTECLFDLLNNKANFIKQRFDNAKKIIDDRHIFDRLNNVMNALKQDWDHEFDKIRRMEINFIDPIRTEDVKAQLVMAKGFVGKKSSILIYYK